MKSKHRIPEWVSWTLVVLMVVAILSMPVLTYIKYTDSLAYRNSPN